MGNFRRNTEVNMDLSKYECPLDWDADWIYKMELPTNLVVDEEHYQSGNMTVHVENYAVFERLLAMLRALGGSFLSSDYKSSSDHLASFHKMLGTKRRFIQEYTDALSSMIYTCEVRLLEKTGDVDKINKAMEKAIPFVNMPDKLKSVVYLFKGASYGTPGKSNSPAFRYLDMSIALNPDEPMFKYVTAKVMSKIRHWEKQCDESFVMREIGLLQESIEKGQLYFAYPILCQTYKDAAQYLRLDSYYSRAAETALLGLQQKEITSHPTMLARCASCLFFLPKFSEKELAIKTFKEAVYMNPTHEFACVAAISPFIALNDFKTAREIAQRGVKLFKSPAARLLELQLKTVFRDYFDIDDEYEDLLKASSKGSVNVSSVELAFSVICLARKDLIGAVVHCVRAIENEVPINAIKHYYTPCLIWHKPSVDVGRLLLNETSIAVYQSQKRNSKKKYYIAPFDISWWEEKQRIIADYLTVTLPYRFDLKLFEVRSLRPVICPGQELVGLRQRFKRI